jgi:hypothetical protein
LLIASLRADHQLVVLDNCEHVVDGVATLVESLLRTCRVSSFSRRVVRRLVLRAKRRGWFHRWQRPMPCNSSWSARVKRCRRSR